MWPLTSARSWEDAREAKRAEQADKIAKGRKALGPRKNTPLVDDLPILSLTAPQIVQAITKDRNYTAVRVLEAFIRSATRAHEATNCLSEIRFVEALEEAKQLDAWFASHKRPKGPLHGVPVSLKDQVWITGLDSTCGVSKYCGQPLQEDGSITTALREAGAILYVKTTVPQTLLSFECSSPIFGITTNPYNSNAVPGGSSGGEAALLASDGSAVGIGSDIGGSCRIPAHYSGVYGIKTSWGRISSRGALNLQPGFQAIRSSFGPMGRSVEDLEVATKVLVQAAKQEWHTENLVPLPWRDQPLPAKLKFGYYKHDNFVETSPACLRAVEESVEALRRAGHELVELEPLDNVMVTAIFSALTSADGHQGLFSHIGSDPKESFLFTFQLLDNMGPLRKPLVGAFGTVDRKWGLIGGASGPKSVIDLYKWQAKKDEFAKQLRTELWKTRGLDGVIAPAQCIPALSPGQSWAVLPCASWTYAFNVCDSTVGVVPVTFVDAKKDAHNPAESKQKGDFSPVVMAAIYGSRFKTGIYNAEKMAGQPVGVQIVGPLFSEEKVLGLMKVLDSALGQRGFGPGEFVKRKG